MTGALPGRAAPSAWAKVPERAAAAAVPAVLLVTLAAAAVAGVLVGGQAALGAALGGALAALLQALTWAAVRLGRGESAQVLALMLVASFATKAGAVLLAVLALGDRLPDARSALVLTAGLAVLTAVVTESVVVTRTRAPYVEV